MAVQIPLPKTTILPELKAGAFTCPHCNVVAQMHWLHTEANGEGRFKQRIRLSTCQTCQNSAVWLVHTDFVDNETLITGEIVYPSPIMHFPHEGLPDDAKKDFMEAAKLATISPRASAALLRLALEKLLAHAGAKENNLNEAIKSLVAKGLPKEVQQALDIVRVTGNSAVHPGKMDDGDVTEISNSLFEIINFLCEELITRQKRLSNLYDKLPKSIVLQIDRRDGRVTSPNKETT